MAKYDGVGWRPVKSVPEAAKAKWTIFPYSSKTQTARGAHFMCADTRTLAHFTCDPVDLSDSEFCQPFYRRAISVLEKIEAEPGILTDQIIDRFSEFERTGIAPVLSPLFIDLMLESLKDMKYIRITDERAYSLGKEPPSRPKIG